MKKLISTLKNIWKIKELRNRILFTLGLLGVYRLGSFVVLPGVVPAALENANQSSGASDLLGLINIFTGGAFNNASIMALGVMPYITASIIIQLLGFAVPDAAAVQGVGNAAAGAAQPLASQREWAWWLMGCVLAYGLLPRALLLLLSLWRWHGGRRRLAGQVDMADPYVRRIVARLDALEPPPQVIGISSIGMSMGAEQPFSLQAATRM